MGYTREILANKQLDDKSVFYTDSFKIEIAESIHIHLRNFRLCFSAEEWKLFAKGIFLSYVRWWLKGKPRYQPTSHNWKLFQGKIHPIAGGGESIIKNDIQIELSQFTDYIHLHFRNTRYEFTVDEFLEYSEEILKARDKIKQMSIMKDYPKRIGYQHIQQPKGRVTQDKNSGGFATHSSRFPDAASKTYDSVLLNKKTKQWEKQLDYNESIDPVNLRSGTIRNIVTKIGKKILSLLNKIFRFF